MSGRIFTVLENNPETVNQLAHSLGLSKAFAFYDVYSLSDRELLAYIPRPVYALLAIIPMTQTWDEARIAEDSKVEEYSSFGPDEPIIWFKQTIIEGCGSIGMLHCTMNGENVNSEPHMILPGSQLDKLRIEAIPLKRDARAQMLDDSDALYEAHQAAASRGDTIPPSFETAQKLGQHFVAFVKGKDGHLYELEGSRKGPLDRGQLHEDDDLLSDRAIQLSMGRLIQQENVNGGDLRFSVIALAPNLDIVFSATQLYERSNAPIAVVGIAGSAASVSRKAIWFAGQGSDARHPIF